MSSIELYYQYLLEHPKRANKKILTVYKKLVNDIHNGVRTEYLDTDTGEVITNTYIFDEAKAVRPIRFIENYCKHSKGKWANKPIKLELFQKALIEAAFGFVDKDTGMRKYNKVVFFVAKKNGKSTIASGLGLYCMMADHEGGAEVYSIAKVKDQAKIVWDEACNMRGKSPQIRKKTDQTISGIYYKEANAKFIPLASNKDTLDGKNPHFIICDEVWAWQDLGLLSMMENGTSAREQAMVFETSTMGPVRGKVFDVEYDYCDKIIKGYLHEDKGIIDEKVLPIIYELDDEKSWLDPECWYQANPNLGVSKKISYMRDKVQKTLNDPSYITDTLCKEFNLRQTASTSWLTFEDLNNEETYDDWTNAYVCSGVDLSSTVDLTCATLLGFKNGKLLVKQMYWIPSNVIEKKIKQDNIRYDIWVKNGWVRTCLGNMVNYSDVTAWFIEQVEKYELRPLWVGYDPWNAQYWVEEMESYGFEMEVVRQGYKTFSPTMKQLKADLMAKKINYNNNPVLKWNLSNLSVKADENDNIRPIKEHQNNRIDGAVSLIDAYAVYMNHMQDFLTLSGGENESIQ